MSKQLLSHRPIWLVNDIERTVDYYAEKLGFQRDLNYGTPAFSASVSREGLQIHFRYDPHTRVLAPRSVEIVDLFLLVADVDTLYSEMVGRGAKVVYGPAQQEYGVKEFYVEDCNGYRLGFGQEISVDRTKSEFFENKVMAGSKFTKVSLEYAAFDDVNLRGSIFQNVNLSSTLFQGTNLSSAAFRNINLNGAVMIDCSIAGLIIRGYDIEALIFAEEARRNGN